MQLKKISPSTLHRTIVAFDMTRDSMTKLVNALKRDFASYTNNSRLVSHYFLVNMLDMARRGELVSALSQSANPSEVVKQKMNTALAQCGQLFGKVDTFPILYWARLLGYCNNDVGLRAVISTALDHKTNTQLYPYTLSECWLYLISALVRSNRLQEADAVLDEIKAAGYKPTRFHYCRLIAASTLAPDRISRVFGYYQHMLKNGEKPSYDEFYTMLSALAGQKKARLKVVEEARKHGLFLRICTSLMVNSLMCM